MSLADLQKLPEGLAEAATIVDGLDLCLAMGMSRLSDLEREKLTAFGEVFAGSPLGEPVKVALEAIAESRFAPEHFLPLAIARASLQASQHDALRAQLAAALQLADSPAVEAPSLQVQDREAVARLSAAQHLLAELAISGFANAQPEQLAGFARHLEALQEHADSARAAALFTSFFHELLETLPVDGPEKAPRRRWGDLWSRGFITASYPAQPDSAQPRPAKGLFTPIGSDVRSSAFFCAAAIHGVFQPDDGGPAFWTWMAFQSYKVDLISGHENWALFRPAIDPLLQALADGGTFQINEGGVFPDGRLTAVEMTAAPATSFDPVALVEKAVGQLPPAPDVYTRHPVHLAQPVLLREIAVTKAGEGWMAKSADGVTLPLFAEANPDWSELGAIDLATLTQLVGFIRFDAGAWRLQPLCGRAKLPDPPAPPKKKVKPPKGGWGEGWVRTGMYALAALTASPSETLEVLSERASKLLRS